ncbi:MAG TPA: GDSL-type esterase/lipase family protein [Actinomycetota bacterium]
MRPSRRILGAALLALTLLAVTAAAIMTALIVTPPQTVSALGQTVTVGTTSPSLSTEGPGEAVLFGRTLPTSVVFVGPVRPRVVLTDISLDAQVSGLLEPDRRGRAVTELGESLGQGWRRYFAWEIAVVAVVAVLLLGAIAGWRRFGWKKTLATILGGLVVAEVVNLGSIMVTAYTAPDILARVSSVGELVGRDAPRPIPPAEGPSRPTVDAVVMGDSTAAGQGGAPLASPGPTDEACGRSASAFARTLADVNGWEVDNLGCGGATIERGILHRQFAGGGWIPAQLATAKQAVGTQAVFVSVGANDLHWSALVALCAAADTCDDRALTAYFQRSLNAFTEAYYELLRQLASLPGDPVVVMNQYYAPFSPDAVDCLAGTGLTSEKVEVLLDRLAILNEVIANGAETFGYRTASPRFDGHELCTDQPYVQGPDEAAPLHPNARGHLVIALADEIALLEG